MKKSEVKEMLNDGSYNYNDNSLDAVEFWKNAVKFFPKDVAKDVASLREFVKNDEEPFRMDDFIFNKTYAEILAPLNLDILVENE
jgi:hypothetical protein